MLIIKGFYHWFPKRIAFRNDYCLTCEAPRRAIQVRTLDVLHIFYIPVLPIGLWKRWFCSFCGQQPSVNKRTRLGFKIAGLVILIVMSVISWFIPMKRDDEVFIWALRIGAPIGVLATALHLRYSARDATYSERFQAVSPASDVACPFCHVPLVAMYCPDCGVERR